MLEEAKKIRVRKSDGNYSFDNAHIEHKNSWAKKLDNLEEKYGEMPKISFHQLDDEGNLKFMQAKRDKVWTTLGWSGVGNVAGIAVATYLHKNSDRYRSLKNFKKRELMQVAGFAVTVGLFTLYGYGAAQQRFVREKIKIV